jgi:hypothetical protein
MGKVGGGGGGHVRKIQLGPTPPGVHKFSKTIGTTSNFYML